MTPTKPMSSVTLYFGLDRLNDVPVSQEEWDAFVEAEVTPHFPIGLTVTDGRGQYRAASGTLYNEDSKVLILVYEQTPQSDSIIERIRSTFKEKYDQESVLRVDSVASASW